ncbi:hypothetical protein CKO51_25985 [Rhodopirellula sp. SM50]|nr:hypothetical protein [Rhodopirellula sp. SM50]PAY16626.1 hypothetical protein CKO51_25985 [Rhodopirellula sp. SM50]
MFPSHFLLRDNSHWKFLPVFVLLISQAATASAGSMGASWPTLGKPDIFVDFITATTTSAPNTLELDGWADKITFEGGAEQDLDAGTGNPYTPYPMAPAVFNLVASFDSNGKLEPGGTFYVEGSTDESLASATLLAGSLVDLRSDFSTTSGGYAHVEFLANTTDDGFDGKFGRQVLLSISIATTASSFLDYFAVGSNGLGKADIAQAVPELGSAAGWALGVFFLSGAGFRRQRRD